MWIVAVVLYVMGMPLMGAIMGCMLKETPEAKRRAAFGLEPKKRGPAEAVAMAVVTLGWPFIGLFAWWTMLTQEASSDKA